VRYHHRLVHLEAQFPHPGDKQRSAGVGVHPGGRPVGRHDHPYPAHGPSSGRTQSPVLPPSLRTTRTPSILAAASIALTMSIKARPAFATAVMASISTPVRSAVLAEADIRTVESSRSSWTATACKAIGWHSGTKAGVCLAPMMPANRATARA